jgi:hypothetical protein
MRTIRDLTEIYKQRNALCTLYYFYLSSTLMMDTFMLMHFHQPVYFRRSRLVVIDSSTCFKLLLAGLGFTP